MPFPRQARRSLPGFESRSATTSRVDSTAYLSGTAQMYMRAQFDDKCPGGLHRRQLQRRIHGAARPRNQHPGEAALRAEGNTTHVFKDYLRDPDLLKDCKVVIWLVCNSSLKNDWPLPQAIHDAGQSLARK